MVIEIRCVFNNIFMSDIYQIRLYEVIIFVGSENFVAYRKALEEKTTRYKIEFVVFLKCPYILFVSIIASIWKKSIEDIVNFSFMFHYITRLSY